MTEQMNKHLLGVLVELVFDVMPVCEHYISAVVCSIA